jgi:signal transduction histidine kinase
MSRTTVLKRVHLWSILVIGSLAGLAMAVPILHRSFGLLAVSDIVQGLLLLSGTVVFVPRAIHAHGHVRLFWILMAVGVGLWFFYQLLWIYIEVICHQSVPDLFWGDIVLFLHLVPLIAAVALRPHVARDEYAARVGHLDFALLFVWWLFLYVFLVLSWQYALANNAAYNHNLNSVYLIEKVALLVALIASCLHSKGPWRLFYLNLFGASLMYAASSYLANWAIANTTYYTGSIYDIPLAASMAWFTLTGLWTKASEPGFKVREISTGYGVSIARLGMIAVYSLPLFAAWSMIDPHIPSPVRSFRVLTTLMAAIAMGMMVNIRQRLLDRELMRLIEQSDKSVDNLQRLQAQVLQQEKLASIGQLVGGAAHELNNPITAMLGYCDLLLSTNLTGSQKALAFKIGQQVRRTKTMVASLLSFVRKAPASRSLVDLNTVVRTAVKVTEPQWQPLKTEIRFQLSQPLPRISGDSNQLLQVCVQIVTATVQAFDEGQPRALDIRTHGSPGAVVLEFRDGAIGESAMAGSARDELLDQSEILGLSACLPVVEEHQGQMSSDILAGGGRAIRLEFPIAQRVEASALSAAPGLVEPQSFS